MPNKEYIERDKALEIVKRTSGDYTAAWSEISRLPAASEDEVLACAAVNAKYASDSLEMLRQIRNKVSVPADAVEVVRCENCEYWKPYSGRIDVKVCYATFDHHGRERLTNPDDFCSCGKRRKE